MYLCKYSFHQYIFLAIFVHYKNRCFKKPTCKATVLFKSLRHLYKNAVK